MYYVFYRLHQRLTLESCFTNLEQTPLNGSQQLPAPYKRLIDEIKQNELRENDWSTDSFTNNKRLFNYWLRVFIANNIKA